MIDLLLVMRLVMRHFAELGMEHVPVSQVFRRLGQGDFLCTGVPGWPKHHSKLHPQDSMPVIASLPSGGWAGRSQV